jgi:hypothetical protein
LVALLIDERLWLANGQRHERLDAQHEGAERQ